MSRLNQKIIVVTGGNGLIGKAILEYIRQEGAIAINAEINVEHDLNNGIVCCDITEIESVKQAIDIVLNKYNRIDGWVNNAYPRTLDWSNMFEKIKVDSWKDNVDMQLNSLFICCQLVLEVMKQQKSGSIVNMSSIYGVVAPDFGVYEGTEMTMPAAYSAIKGGVVNFSRYIASYFGKYGIRINCVSPGGIFDNQNKIFVKQYIKKTPMGRMGLPIEVAKGVSFLLSDDASYITGHNLMIDGGWTAI